MPRIFIIVLLASVLSPISSAQMRGGAHVAIHGTGSRHFRSGGFGYPFFYSDYGEASAGAPPAPANFVEKRVFEPERLAQPLLIEWQGDRFVRYGGAQAGAPPQDYVEVASRTTTAPATRPGTGSDAAPEIPPAVLIYRDGHREQVSDYVITRGVLYARGDYLQGAPGMRNIQLSALDLSATFRANEHNGVKFVLPAGPNEVVTRP
jgi:hypothetical protein